MLDVLYNWAVQRRRDILQNTCRDIGAGIDAWKKVVIRGCKRPSFGFDGSFFFEEAFLGGMLVK